MTEARGLSGKTSNHTSTTTSSRQCRTSKTSTSAQSTVTTRHLAGIAVTKDRPSIDDIWKKRGEGIVCSRASNVDRARGSAKSDVVRKFWLM